MSDQEYTPPPPPPEVHNILFPHKNVDPEKPIPIEEAEDE